jgi:PAS domain S-box-containing protein
MMNPIEANESAAANAVRVQDRTLLDHAFDAIFVWDWDGAISQWNRGAELLYGYSPGQAIGQVSHDLLRTTQPDGTRPLRQIIEREGSWQGELRHVRRDGTWITVESRQVLVPDGDRPYVLEINRDLTARKRAEDRLSFLSQASVILAESLDPKIILSKVSQLVVPHLADWCVVHLIETDGGVAQLEVAHVDPNKVAWARDLQEQFPYDPDALHGVPQVLRSRTSELYAEIPLTLLEASARSGEELKLLVDIGMTSVMIVPLIVQARALGTITFVAADEGRHYDTTDLAFAEELAQRCALAVDNARLFGQTRDAEEYVRHVNAELEARVAERTTQLSSANERLARWGQIFERANIGIAVKSPDGTQIDLVNPAYAGMHGYSVDELNGQPASKVVPAEVADTISIEFAIALKRGWHLFETVHCRSDGSTFPVQIDVTAVNDEQHTPRFLVANVQDITERKQAEAALKDANRELESFSYSVSHDLRAPLRSIDGFSRILVEDYEPILPDEAKRYLQIVRKGTVQMGQLIDDLLDFSRMGRKPLRVQPIRPASVAYEALDGLRFELNDRPVELVIGELPGCQADLALLRQVFTNLLSNALKYTRGREPARIEVGALAESVSDTERTYFVRDNGVGFDMIYAPKLFGVFQRLHRSEDYEGTGVGLALVQRIIHRHGGRVWAEAALDQGATFWFTLPAEDTVAEAPAVA